MFKGCTVGRGRMLSRDKIACRFSETVDWNHNGVLQDWGAGLGFQVDLRKQTTFSINRGEAYERLGNFEFRKHSTSLFFATQPYKWISFSARYARGTGENFFSPP